MITVRATIQQVPPDNRGDHDLDRREVSEAAADYQAAVDTIDGQVPEGWRVIALRVDR